MAFWTRWVEERAARRAAHAEPAAPPAAEPERTGFEYGIPPQGLNEYFAGTATGDDTDRRTMMTQLYKAYTTCPWAWSSVSAISRTITAGGLVTDWDFDTGEGDQPAPDKPPEVLNLERLLAFCNPRDDIRQLLRCAVVDMLVFGDAFIELVWLGDVPVALYNLDCASMYPLADEHGTITGYVQITEYGQRAEFEPRDVIHIPLDSPRTGVFGFSPTQAAVLPITAWLFGAANLKELYRKGAPPVVHVDMPAGMSVSDMNRWDALYAQRNLGSRNIGNPIVTRGGAHITELAAAKIVDNLSFLDQKRDEILAVYGVPPAQGGVIEAGHLGAGTGEAQAKTFKINTCQPIAELLLEKLNFALTRQAFRIVGWHLKFQDVDYRDSKLIEEIRDTRLRNGSWTLNRYRNEIGEPPVTGGDNATLVDRQNVVLWRDIQAMSEATVLSKRAPGVAAGDPAIADSLGDAHVHRDPMAVLADDGPNDDGIDTESAAELTTMLELEFRRWVESVLQPA